MCGRVRLTYEAPPGNWLFRGVRHAEIDAGYRLIPKAQRPFLDDAQLPLTFPLSFGPSVEHAVRNHQRDSDLNQTRGVSTTPHFERAVHYARCGVVVRIDVEAASRLGILLHRVADHVPPQGRTHPEDDEVILVSSVDGEFPAEIIAEVIRV